VRRVRASELLKELPEEEVEEIRRLEERGWRVVEALLVKKSKGREESWEELWIFLARAGEGHEGNCQEAGA